MTDTPQQTLPCPGNIDSSKIWDIVTAIHGDAAEWDFDACFEAVAIAFEMGDRWDWDAAGQHVMVQALAWFSYERRLLIEGARKAVYHIEAGELDRAARALGFPLAVVDDPFGDE